MTDNISSDYYNDYKNSIVTAEKNNTVACKFDTLITQACQRTFDVKEIKNFKHYKKAKWFDRECLFLRSQAVEAGERLFTAQDRQQHSEACKKYRACKQRKKRQFKSKCISEID